MGKTPEVSVIVPMYDDGVHLYQCLDSIYWQTLGDVEVICVDYRAGESGTYVAREFAAKDARFRILETYDEGLSGARNVGLRAATGNYILFLGARDWIAHRLCELVVNEARDCAADVVYFNVLKFNDQGMYDDAAYPYPITDGCFRPRDFREVLAWSTLSGMIMRKTVLSGLEFSDAWGEAAEPLVAEVGLRAIKGILVDEPIYYQREDGYRASTGRPTNDCMEAVQSSASLKQVLRRYNAFNELYEDVYAARELRHYLDVMKTASREELCAFLPAIRSQPAGIPRATLIDGYSKRYGEDWEDDRLEQGWALLLVCGGSFRDLKSLSRRECGENAWSATRAIPVLGGIVSWWMAFSHIILKR